MLVERFEVNSPNVEKGEGYISSSYDYQHNEIELKDGKWTVQPVTTKYEFRTETNVPKLG